MGLARDTIILFISFCWGSWLGMDVCSSSLNLGEEGRETDLGNNWVEREPETESKGHSLSYPKNRRL